MLKIKNLCAKFARQLKCLTVIQVGDCGPGVRRFWSYRPSQRSESSESLSKSSVKNEEICDEIDEGHVESSDSESHVTVIGHVDVDGIGEEDVEVLGGGSPSVIFIWN